MELPSSEPRPTYEQLVAENATLREQNAAFQSQVAKLTAQLQAALLRLQAAEAEIAELKRKSSGPAPFSKGQGKPNPKKAGRKPGEGPFRRREAPEGALTGAVEVPVEPATCECGGEFEADGYEFVSTTEVPPIPEPEVKTFKMAFCRCQDCGKRVRGEHPAVPPNQTGATAHRVGERAMGIAHLLHYGFGVTVQQVPRVLRMMYGLKVTQSALTQDAIRRTVKGRLGHAYQALRQAVRGSPTVHTDDTGWKIGGDQAWLMGFETEEVRVYQIRRRHRNEEVREIIPGDYAGVMTTDRGPSYDAKAFDAVRQQKCLAHLQRNLSDVLARKTGKAAWFASHLQWLLAEALDLWWDWREGKQEDYETRAARIRVLLTCHLRDRRLHDQDNQRLLNGLGWHHDRGNLLRFLDEPGIVAPTNNAAERALRGAVIARKVSQCSKTDRGAEAHSAFCSVIATLKKRCPDDLVGGLLQVFQTGAVPVRAVDTR